MLGKWRGKPKENFGCLKMRFWLSEYLHRPYLVTQCAGIPKGLEHVQEKKGKDLDLGLRPHLKCNFVSQNLIM